MAPVLDIDWNRDPLSLLCRRLQFQEQDPARSSSALGHAVRWQSRGVGDETVSQLVIPGRCAPPSAVTSPSAFLGPWGSGGSQAPSSGCPDTLTVGGDVCPAGCRPPPQLRARTWRCRPPTLRPALCPRGPCRCAPAHADAAPRPRARPPRLRRCCAARPPTSPWTTWWRPWRGAGGGCCAWGTRPGSWSPSGGTAWTRRWLAATAPRSWRTSDGTSTRSRYVSPAARRPGWGGSDPRASPGRLARPTPSCPSWPPGSGSGAGGAAPALSVSSGLGRLPGSVPSRRGLLWEETPSLRVPSVGSCGLDAVGKSGEKTTLNTNLQRRPTPSASCPVVRPSAASLRRTGPQGRCGAPTFPAGRTERVCVCPPASGDTGPCGHASALSRVWGGPAPLPLQQRFRGSVPRVRRGDAACPCAHVGDSLVSVSVGLRRAFQELHEIFPIPWQTWRTGKLSPSGP